MHAESVMKTFKLVQPGPLPRASQIRTMMSKDEFNHEKIRRRRSRKPVVSLRTARTLTRTAGLLVCETTSSCRMDKVDYDFGSFPTAGEPSGLLAGVQNNDGNAKTVGY
jgi:hypothetical protein